MNEEDLNYLIGVDADLSKTEKALRDFAATAGKTGKDISDQWSKGMLESTLKNSTEHAASMTKLRDAMNPEVLGLRVKQMRELTAAQEAYNDALKKEQRRQEGEGMPGAGKRLTDIVRGGIGSTIKEMLGKLAGGDLEGFKEQMGGIVSDVKSVIGSVFGGAAKKASDVPKIEVPTDPGEDWSTKFSKLPDIISTGGINKSAKLSDVVAGVGESSKAATAAETAVPAVEAAGAGAAAGASSMAAMAGPIGLAVAAGVVLWEKASPVIGAAIGAPAQLVVKGLQIVKTGLTELGGRLGPIGMGLEFASQGFAAVSEVIKSIPVVGTVLGPFTDALAAMPSLIKEVTSTLVSFAGVASPTSMKQFQVAVEDVQGVIGRAFVPVLYLMRDAVRLFGDVLATILPNTQEVSGALTGLRIALSEAFAGIRLAIGPIGEQMRGQFLEGLRRVGDVLAKIVPVMAGGFVTGLQMVSDLMGKIGTYVGGVISVYSGLFKIREALMAFVEPVSSILGPMNMLSKVFDGVIVVVTTLGTVLSTVGDVWGNITRPLSEGFAVVKSSLGELGEVFGELYSTLKEVFSGVGSELMQSIRPLLDLMNPLQLLGDVLRMVAVGIREVATRLRDFLAGLGLVSATRATPSTAPARSSVGAASREGQFAGFEEYQKQLQLSAFREPGQIGMEQLPQTVNKMHGVLEAWSQMLTPANIARALADVIGPAMRQALIDAIPSPARDIVQRNTPVIADAAARGPVAAMFSAMFR